MPAADELFRSTAGNATLLQSQRPEEPERDRAGAGRIGVAPRTAPAAPQSQPQSAVSPPATVPAQVQASTAATAEADRSGAAPGSGASQPAPATPRAAATKKSAPRRPSGRERHDEKITVYVSPDELLGLEHARITLRGEYGVGVDRGRIVREAIAALLADLDARGPDSILVKRLSAGG